MSNELVAIFYLADFELLMDLARRNWRHGRRAAALLSIFQNTADSFIKGTTFERNGIKTEIGLPLLI